MTTISSNITIPEHEIEISYVRSSGPGGQNINKVSTAVHLRFDVKASSLPDWLKNRIYAANDSRITSKGVIIIKANEYRSQSKNRKEAIDRLREMIKELSLQQKKRRPTVPSKAFHEKRLESKKKKSQIKEMRKQIKEFPT